MTGPKLAPADDPILPLARYHEAAVIALFELVIASGWVNLTSWRNQRPDPSEARRLIALNAADLDQLNAYLGVLTYVQVRALVGYLGLDDGTQKNLDAVADRFGVSRASISAQVKTALSRLQHPSRTRRPT